MGYNGKVAKPEHPLRRIWNGMKLRCRDPECPGYGARGIRVHPDWIDNFQAFADHMGPRPSKDHSIDRMDNNGHYEPGNVRWATRVEQGRNKRNNLLLEFRGEKRPLSEWAELTGLTEPTISERIHQLGWPVEKALTTAPGAIWGPGRRPDVWEIDGVGKTLHQWAASIGMKYETLYGRMNVSGLSLREALAKPMRKSPTKRR